MLHLDLLVSSLIFAIAFLLMWRNSKKPRDEAKITPKDEKETLAMFLQYGGSVAKLKWTARASSTAFFIWFTLGYFSLVSAIPFSMYNVFVFSTLICTLHELAIGVALCQIQTGRDLAERDYETVRYHETVRYNKMTLVEVVPFWVLHVAIALVANFQRL